METIFDDMRLLYQTRRLSMIDPFIKKWIAPDCVVMGTALGELERTPEEVRGLFDGDLRHWYDLALDAPRAEKTPLGDFELWTCPARSVYTILENDARYRGYIGACDEIRDEATVSGAIKGARIAFLLDTLLPSRSRKRRKNDLPLTVRALLRGGKARFLSFAYDKTIDTADDYLGGDEWSGKRYAYERGLLRPAQLPAAAEALAGIGCEDAVYESPDGRIFYGLGYVRRRETLDEAMEKALCEYRQEDAYRTLFDLRLRLSYLQKVYAIEARPRAVLRFWGLIREGGAPLLLPAFPLSAYLEWR